MAIIRSRNTGSRHPNDRGRAKRFSEIARVRFERQEQVWVAVKCSSFYFDRFAVITGISVYSDGYAVGIIETKKNSFLFHDDYFVTCLFTEISGNPRKTTKAVGSNAHVRMTEEWVTYVPARSSDVRL